MADQRIRRQIALLAALSYIADLADEWSCPRDE
jgi:hypothetical protein